MTDGLSWSETRTRKRETDTFSYGVPWYVPLGIVAILDLEFYMAKLVGAISGVESELGALDGALTSALKQAAKGPSAPSGSPSGNAGPYVPPSTSEGSGKGVPAWGTCAPMVPTWLCRALHQAEVEVD